MSPATVRRLAHVRNEVANALADLEPLFVDGTRFTFIARNVSEPDATVIVTSDELPEVVAALGRELNDVPTPETPR